MHVKRAHPGLPHFPGSVNEMVKLNFGHDVPGSRLALVTASDELWIHEIACKPCSRHPFSSSVQSFRQSNTCVRLQYWFPTLWLPPQVPWPPERSLRQRSISRRGVWFGRGNKAAAILPRRYGRLRVSALLRTTAPHNERPMHDWSELL